MPLPARRLPLMLLLLLSTTACLAAPDQVLLFRHAEKASEPAGDPALSADGRARADALADALRHAGVDAIIVTQYRRTGETAAPLARRLGIEPQVVEAGADGLQAHVDAVADAVRAQQGVVLVVGHSNTLAPVIEVLGGPALDDLAESDYGDLFVLTPGDGGDRLLRATVGD